MIDPCDSEALLGLIVTVNGPTGIGAQRFLTIEERRNATSRVFVDQGDRVTIVRLSTEITARPAVVLKFSDGGYGWLFADELNLSPLDILAAAAESTTID